jgi:hypothetical protein
LRRVHPIDFAAGLGRQKMRVNAQRDRRVAVGKLRTDIRDRRARCNSRLANGCLRS